MRPCPVESRADAAQGRAVTARNPWALVNRHMGAVEEDNRLPLRIPRRSRADAGARAMRY
jgi:hypothetical protein